MEVECFDVFICIATGQLDQIIATVNDKEFGKNKSFRFKVHCMIFSVGLDIKSWAKIGKTFIKPQTRSGLQLPELG